MTEKILLVDDDQRLLETLTKHLQLLGYAVVTAAGGSEAIDCYDREQPDIAIVDVRMPPPDGLQVLRAIRERNSRAEVLLFTGHGDTDVVIDALRGGASDFITKPPENGVLETALRQAAERLATQRKLKQAQERVQFHAQLLDAVEQAVIATDLEGRITYWNRFSETLYGWRAEEVIGRNILDVTPSEAMQDQAAEIMARIRAGQSWTGEFLVQRRNGEEFPILVTDSPVYDPQGELVGIVGVSIDITEQKRTENLLKRHAKELQALNKTSQAISSTLNLDEVLRRAMNEARAILKAEAASVLLLGEDEETLVFAASVGPAAALLTGKHMPATSGVAGWVASTGTPALLGNSQVDERFYPQIDALTGLTTRSLLAAPLTVKGQVIGVIEAVDNTEAAFNTHDLDLFSALASSTAVAIENARLYRAEREQRELVEETHAQLVQSEKLAATGRLAASMAHEINNPLQAIQSGVQLLRDIDMPPEEQHEYLVMVHSEIERLIDIVERVLNFAKHSRRGKTIVCVREIIDRVLALTQRYFQSRRVDLQCDLAPDLPPVEAVPNELSQAALNLVLNAMDAMPQGGTLRITSQRVDGGVTLAFSDTGCGIPAAHLEHIFEPFFTTKGDGTGLGLMICHNIVERHNGRISVESVEGEGTTFTIWLPAAPKREKTTKIADGIEMSPALSKQRP